MAGPQESCGLGRDALKERPSSFEEKLPRFLWKLFLRNAVRVVHHGGEWIIFYIIVLN